MDATHIERGGAAPAFSSGIGANKMTTTYESKKHQGDNCEMLVLAELTRAGISAFRTPTNHPGHDIIAHVPGEQPVRIQVKSRRKS
jgi:hypothetical protein